jgi:site-specific DNA recombinase
MNVDKLDGRIDSALYRKLSEEWRIEQDRYAREITWHRTADRSYMDEGVRLLELAHNAQRLFEKKEPHEKRRLVNFVLSNSTWKGGSLIATFRQPFDLLAETAAIAAATNGGEGLNLPGHSVWLPGPDSNQRPTG